MNFGENRSREANNESTTLLAHHRRYSLGDVANNFAFAMGALFLLVTTPTSLASVPLRRAPCCYCAGIRCLRRRLCRTSGGQCETRWGKFRPFLLFGTAPLMILACWYSGCRPTGAMVAKWCMLFDLHGPRALLQPGEYSLWFLATAMTQQPQSRARLGAARGLPLH